MVTLLDDGKVRRPRSPLRPGNPVIRLGAPFDLWICFCDVSFMYARNKTRLRGENIVFTWSGYRKPVKHRFGTSEWGLLWGPICVGEGEGGEID